MNFVTVGTVFRSFTFHLSFLRFLWFCGWRLALGDGLALLKVGLGDGVAKQVELVIESCFYSSLRSSWDLDSKRSLTTGALLSDAWK